LRYPFLGPYGHSRRIAQQRSPSGVESGSEPTQGGYTVLLFDAVRLTSAEYFVSLAIIVVFNLPSLGHKVLALARDYDDFRANRPEIATHLSKQDDDRQWEAEEAM
jgi:hypothetical protein